MTIYYMSVSVLPTSDPAGNKAQAFTAVMELAFRNDEHTKPSIM